MEIETMGDLTNHLGEKVGVSDWLLIDQALIERFGDVTLDRNWYQVDLERAKRELPDGKTIAHGFLLLSLTRSWASRLSRCVITDGCSTTGSTRSAS